MLINAKVLIGGLILIEGFGFEVLENDFNKSKYLYKRYEYLMTKWNQKNVSKLREIVTIICGTLHPFSSSQKTENGLFLLKCQ